MINRTTGPLRPREIAFLRAGGVLIRCCDDRAVVMMWLTRSPS
jgi:hypothetical protein